MVHRKICHTLKLSRHCGTNIILRMTMVERQLNKPILFVNKHRPTAV